MRRFSISLAILLLAALPAAATPIGLLDESEQAAAEALALYDEATTRHALEAVTEADVFADVVRQQARSSERFQQLLSPYERDVQEQIFEITRYPELIARIVEGGPKSPSELEAIAAFYPEEERAAIVAVGSSHWKLITRIEVLLNDETAWLESRIAELPETKREAFRALVATPELMALLAENTALTVLLGDAYEREPEAVVAWLAELRQQAEQQGAEEAWELAQATEDDADLASEIEAATSAYEQETGYSAYQPTVVYETQVYVRPYAYWVGYPWWYDVSYSYYSPWYYWYPSAYWSFGGFTFGPRWAVSFGFPHGGFWGWYFQWPLHHHHYPHVTHHVVQHYDYRYAYRHHDYRHARHRVRHHRSAAHAVSHFRSEVEHSMPRTFLRDDRHRVDRFREYGRVRDEARRDRNASELTERPRRTRAAVYEAKIETRREIKAERRRERAEARQVERRQSAKRERAAPVARPESATKPSASQPRFEKRERRASKQEQFDRPRREQPRQEARPESATKPSASQPRFEKREQRSPKQQQFDRPRREQPRQEARPASPAPTPRAMNAERSERKKQERVRSKTRRNEREQRDATRQPGGRRRG